jgi:hypothetical protein
VLLCVAGARSLNLAVAASGFAGCCPNLSAPLSAPFSSWLPRASGGAEWGHVLLEAVAADTELDVAGSQGSSGP